ncbi:hypothetical protein [Methylobacterium sp. OT2]|uniref:hypothetical protein n=1 Tax=Methylobacterium sp. OT2 TaxID=2813779 RepID=UPI001FEF8716|nr:hypothetical protein [Methylobacterium sp. OT2]
MDAEAVARMMAAQDAEETSSEPVEPDIAPEAELAGLAEETTSAPGISLEANAAAETIDAAPAESEAEFFDAGKIDGRTLRKTGREPFATRIKPEAHAALRRIAYARRITMAEALELAVAAYEKRHKPESRKPVA